MWLTRLALRYPISTFLLAMTILVFGIVSFQQLPVDLLPDISIPVVTTVTFYPGAGPLDMEQSVTRLIERTVSSTNNVDYVQSSTKEGISQVRINFNWDANLDVGLVDVIQRVNRILNQMPTGISQPQSLRFDITNLPVCTIAVSGDMDERDLYDHPGGYTRLMSNQTVGKPCRNCGTAIQKISYLGGACYICPTCQVQA